MNRVAAALLLPLFVAPVHAANTNSQGSPTPFEPFADSLMSAQLEKQHVPGGVLVVVRDGAVAFARGYGFADLEKRTPVDAERTVFRVASVSKLLTATAVMQLVEQGRLDLHADVNRYLVHFKVPAIYPRPVTLFDLLTHTAGFDDDNLARKAHEPGDVGPLGDYLARRLPPRVRAPGEAIAYSNHGMALAGHLVELASGLSFERYMKERIFGPLGMARSSFALVPDSSALLATGYAGDPPRPQPRDYTRTVPASMLSATGADMARFMIAHLEGSRAGGGAILGDTSLAVMHRQQFTQHSKLAGVGLGFWERFQNGERAIWHDGDASGFASLLYLLPNRHIGYFMAFNSRAGAPARREILAALLDHDVPRAAPPPHHDSSAASDAMRLAGTYRDLRSAHRTIEKIAAIEQDITVTAGAGGALDVVGIAYFPIGDGVFATADGDGRLAFATDRAGRVTRLFVSRSTAKAYDRVAWHGTAGVLLGWLLACVLGFLWCAVGTPIAWALQRRARAAAPPAARWVGRSLSIASALGLAFIAGMVCTLAGAFGSLEYGIPVALPVLLTLPLVTTVLTLVALLGFVRAWQADGRAFSRALLVIGMIASLAFIPWLAYWNMLGYRY